MKNKSSIVRISQVYVFYTFLYHFLTFASLFQTFSPPLLGAVHCSTLFRTAAARPCPLRIAWLSCAGWPMVAMAPWLEKRQKVHRIAQIVCMANDHSMIIFNDHLMIIQWGYGCDDQSLMVEKMLVKWSIHVFSDKPPMALCTSIESPQLPLSPSVFSRWLSLWLQAVIAIMVPVVSALFELWRHWKSISSHSCRLSPYHLPKIQIWKQRNRWNSARHVTLHQHPQHPQRHIPPWSPWIWKRTVPKICRPSRFYCVSWSAFLLVCLEVVGPFSQCPSWCICYMWMPRKPLRCPWWWWELPVHLPWFPMPALEMWIGQWVPSLEWLGWQGHFWVASLLVTFRSMFWCSSSQAWPWPLLRPCCARTRQPSIKSYLP